MEEAEITNFKNNSEINTVSNAFRSSLVEYIISLKYKGFNLFKR